MKRGDILHYIVGGRQIRVAVISADRYNPAHALIAPLRERAAPARSPAFLVPLDRNDWPTVAVVDLSYLRSLDPSAVVGAAGRLSQETSHTLDLAVRTYLGGSA